MLYEEWAEWHWDSYTVSDQRDFVDLMEHEKQTGMARIEEYFTSLPKYVIQISQDTFLSLPPENSDSNWPDFKILVKWIKENCDGEWYQYDPVYYIFENDIDAMAFRLAWG